MAAARYPVARSLTRGSGNQLSFSVVRPSARAAGIQAVSMTRSPFTAGAPTQVTEDTLFPLPSSANGNGHGHTNGHASGYTGKVAVVAVTATAAAAAAAESSATSLIDDVPRGPSLNELILRHGQAQRDINAVNTAAIADARRQAEALLATNERAFYIERRECDERQAAERAEMERRHAAERADIAAREEASRQAAAVIIATAEAEAKARSHQLDEAHKKLIADAGGITRRTATQTASSIAAAPSSSAHRTRVAVAASS